MSDPHTDHAHHGPRSFWTKYVFSTDHKIIGLQFTFASLLFVILGGLLALAVRYQIAWPGQNVPYAQVLPGGVLPEDAPGPRMTSPAAETNLGHWDLGGKVRLIADVEVDGRTFPADAAGELKAFPRGIAVNVPAGTIVEQDGQRRTLREPLRAFVERKFVMGDYDPARATRVHASPGVSLTLPRDDQPDDTLVLRGMEIPRPDGRTVDQDTSKVNLDAIDAETLVTITVKAQTLGAEGEAAVAVAPATIDVSASQIAYTKQTLTGDAYLTLFTMHASIMIFFVIIPMLVGGFGNFLIPLMVGARDMAFPRLNMLSFWIAVPVGVLMIASFWVTGGAAGGGWTMYPPLSANPQYMANTWGTHIWVFGVALVGFSSIVGALNYITTIINMRAPGMGLFRMPLTVWSLFITAILQLFATPVLTAVMILLFLDRTLGTMFFAPVVQRIVEGEIVMETVGGQPLLFQHLFWFYSHPAVYIMILPAMGIVSDVIATYARKPVFGYRPMVFAICAIAGLGFIVWGHHMFQSGMNPVLGTTFMAATIMIAVPSAIKTFNWLGTLWGGDIRFTPAMLNAIGFVSMFVVGGLSGIFMASAPVDIHIHDTYFIVAHIHYVLFGGSIFGIFAGIYHWFPKMFGRDMNHKWGVIHFILTIIAFNGTFFLMHILGVGGHPRRYASIMSFPTLEHLQPMNVVMTLWAISMGLGQIVFFFNFFASLPRKLGRGIVAFFAVALVGPTVIGLAFWTGPTWEGTSLTFHALPAWGFWTGVAGLGLALVALLVSLLIGLPRGGKVAAVAMILPLLAYCGWLTAKHLGAEPTEGWDLTAFALMGAVGAGAWASLALTLIVLLVWYLGGLLRLPMVLSWLLYPAFLPLFLLPMLVKKDLYMAWGIPGLHAYWPVLVALLALPGLAYLILRRPRDVFGAPTVKNPWHANSLEWVADSPPIHTNFATIPTVYRGPYEYSSPVVEEDYLPQDHVLPAGVVEPSGH